MAGSMGIVALNIHTIGAIVVGLLFQIARGIGAALTVYYILSLHF